MYLFNNYLDFHLHTFIVQNWDMCKMQVKQVGRDGVKQILFCLLFT